MKTALVTGASGDIGQKITVALLQNGYKVIAQYCQNKAPLDNLAAIYGQKIVAVFGDFSTVDSIADFTNKLDKMCKKIDVVINNAGVACECMLMDNSATELAKLVNINLMSTMLISQKISQKMMWERAGSIINISSIWGEVGASCEVAYSATKGAIIAFTKALAKELGAFNIRVNCITPGYIDTKMNQCLSNAEQKEFCQNIALGRIGKADEVAQAVLFLASSNASYITGQVLGVNGGI